MDKRDETSEERQQRLVEIIDRLNNGTDGEQKKATEEILAECDGFIGHMIHKHFAPFANEHYWDLYDEGVIAVLSEIRRYDPTRTKLTTFLTPHLKGAMSRYVNTMLTNRSSSHYSGIMNQVRDAQKKLSMEGIEPTVENLVEKTGLSPKMVEQGLQMITASEEKYYEDASQLEEMVTGKAPTPENSLLDDEENETLHRAIQELDDGDMQLLCMFYGLNDEGREYRIAEIAEIADMPPKAVRQSLMRSLRILEQNPDLKALYNTKERKKQPLKESLTLSHSSEEMAALFDADLGDDEIIPEQTKKAEKTNQAAEPEEKRAMPTLELKW